MATHTQRSNKFSCFLDIKKTYGTKGSEKTIAAHFYSDKIEGSRSTRYMRVGTQDKTNEVLYKELEGVFLDEITGVVSGVTILPAKALENGKEVPEKIAVDFLGENGAGMERISFFLDSKFGDAFMRVASLVDFDKEVTLVPNAYYPKESTQLRETLKVLQNGEQLTDKYTVWEKVGEKNVPKNQNGLEKFDSIAAEAKGIENEKLRSAKWKEYFTNVSVFLSEELKKLSVYGREVEAVDVTFTGDAKVAGADVPF